MPIIKSIFAWPLLRLKMIRVGHGFTVHSPFAYHFIMSCLRERLPYYPFRKEVKDKAGRRLFRVAAYFNPATVSYRGNSSEATRIIKLACPHAREVENGADFTYVGEGEQLPEDFNILYAAKTKELPTRAMIFTNGRTLIAVRRHGLPAQSFLLKF